MNNKKGFSVMVEAIVLALVVILALPVRTIQYYSVIEHGTGFYTQQTFTITLLYILVAVAFVFYFVMGIIKAKKFELETEQSKKLLPGIAAAVAGVGVMVSAYLEFAHKGDNTSAYIVTNTIPSNTFNVLFIIKEVFALLAAVYFILLAITFLMGNKPTDFKLLSLAPVFWLMVKLVSKFTITISYIRVSDLLFEILMLSCYIIFYMTFAQANTKVNPEDGQWKLITFGFTGALLGFIVFVPRFILTITGHSDCFFILSRADLADFGLAFFAVATVCTRLIPKNKNEAPNKTESK